MAEELSLILQELKLIRTYLIKIGPSRRVGNILDVKRAEANDVLAKYNTCVQCYKNNLKLGKIKSSEIVLINRICEEFDSLYSNVIKLCSDTVENSPQSDNMASETFDLKIALSILPVMTNNDDNTKQLIEGIEYYSSVLTAKECKTKLTQFVLKSRLSQQAKLRLSQKYDSIDELIRDMKKLLLPQKSYTALQTKLMASRQNNKTIADFGKEISELFVDLTISQADGDSDKYNVLRPLNEKLAIKKFGDGLRNSRLSTVIAARNYSSLTDAIQAAQDEEMSSPSASEGVMGMYKQHNNYAYRRRPQRGHYARQRGFLSFYNRSRGYQPRPYNHQEQYQQVKSSQNNYHANAFRSNRGRYLRGRGRSARGHVNLMATEQNVESEIPQMESLSHFFRD